MANDKNPSVVYAKKVVNNSGAGGAIYGLGIIGALFYYFQYAHTFADVIWGIVKAVFWPSVIIYEVLKMLKL